MFCMLDACTLSTCMLVTHGKVSHTVICHESSNMLNFSIRAVVVGGHH